jgi:hypothetical protein
MYRLFQLGNCLHTVRYHRRRNFLFLSRTGPTGETISYDDP